MGKEDGVAAKAARTPPPKAAVASSAETPGEKHQRDLAEELRQQSLQRHGLDAAVVRP